MLMAITVVLMGCASAVSDCDGSISGQKLGCDENGIDGWTINLYSSDPSSNPDPIKTTNTSTVDGVVGHYEFTGLDTGTYWVCEELQSGYTPLQIHHDGTDLKSV
jgi:hypothetical protein